MGSSHSHFDPHGICLCQRSSGNAVPHVFRYYYRGRDTQIVEGNETILLSGIFKNVDSIIHTSPGKRFLNGVKTMYIRADNVTSMRPPKLIASH